MRCRWLPWFVGLVLAIPTMVTAQGTICWKAGAMDRCGVVVMTNVGAYGTLGPGASYEWTAAGNGPTLRRGIRAGARAVADWGAMAVVSPRDAIGMSMTASIEANRPDDEAELAVYIRYRRLMGTMQSMDFGLGVPVLSDQDQRSLPRGLVKWNINSWFGLALRPELRRTLDDPTAFATKTTWYVATGFEAGHVPGLIGSVLGVAATFVSVLVALARSD